MAKENPQQDNFNAEELGEQSIYEDTTDMLRQMSRGDETKGDPDSRDAAGARHPKDTEEGRQDRDTIKRDLGKT